VVGLCGVLVPVLSLGEEEGDLPNAGGDIGVAGGFADTRGTSGVLVPVLSLGKEEEEGTYPALVETLE
jgi:hypothetical protein